METHDFYTKTYYKTAKIGSLILLTLNIISIILTLFIKSDFFTILSMVIIIIHVFWLAFVSLLKEPYITIKDNEVFAPFYLWYKGYEFDNSDIMWLESIPLEEIESVEYCHINIKKKSKEKKKIAKILMKDELIICVEIDIFRDSDIEKIKDFLECSHINTI